MNKFIVLVLLATIGCAVCRPAEEKYETKYDSVDWKGILANERLTRNYIDCVLDKKPCPNDGAYLKSIIPEAMKTDCAKCSDKQREAAKVVLTTLHKNKPEWFAELQTAFDPEKTYLKKYEKELKEAA